MRQLLILYFTIITPFVFGQNTKLFIQPSISPTDTNIILDILPFNDAERNAYMDKINDYDFTRASPLEYLRYISSFKDSTYGDDSSFSIMSFEIIRDTAKFTNKNWITKNDIIQLMPFINSKQFCKCIYFDENPCQGCNYYVGESTIGIETMRVIDVYRMNRFFTGCSTAFCTKDMQDKLATEYKQWWNHLIK